MCFFGGAQWWQGWCLCRGESGSGLRNCFSIPNKEFNKRANFKNPFSLDSINPPLRAAAYTLGCLPRSQCMCLLRLFVRDINPPVTAAAVAQVIQTNLRLCACVWLWRRDKKKERKCLLGHVTINSMDNKIGPLVWAATLLVRRYLMKSWDARLASN